MLSAREMQALSLIARGFSDRDISVLLDVSFSTARKHRENVQRKLGLRKASQLTIYYLEHFAEPCKKTIDTTDHTFQCEGGSDHAAVCPRPER